MKKILATGAVLAYIAWFNSTGAVAATLPEIAVTDIQGPKHHQNARQKKGAEDKIIRLADKLGLDADELERDLTSQKSLKQILKKHGITKNQLRQVLGKRYMRI